MGTVAATSSEGMDTVAATIGRSTGPDAEASVSETALADATSPGMTAVAGATSAGINALSGATSAGMTAVSEATSAAAAGCAASLAAATTFNGWCTEEADRAGAAPTETEDVVRISPVPPDCNYCMPRIGQKRYTAELERGMDDVYGTIEDSGCGAALDDSIMTSNILTDMCFPKASKSLRDAPTRTFTDDSTFTDTYQSLQSYEDNGTESSPINGFLNPTATNQSKPVADLDGTLVSFEPANEQPAHEDNWRKQVDEIDNLAEARERNKRAAPEAPNQFATAAAACAALPVAVAALPIAAAAAIVGAGMNFSSDLRKSDDEGMSSKEVHTEEYGRGDGTHASQSGDIPLVVPDTDPSNTVGRDDESCTSDLRKGDDEGKSSKEVHTEEYGRGDGTYASQSGDIPLVVPDTDPSDTVGRDDESCTGQSIEVAVKKAKTSFWTKPVKRNQDSVTSTVVIENTGGKAETQRAKVQQNIQHIRSVAGLAKGTESPPSSHNNIATEAILPHQPATGNKLNWLESNKPVGLRAYRNMSRMDAIEEAAIPSSSPSKSIKPVDLRAFRNTKQMDVIEEAAIPSSANDDASLAGQQSCSQSVATRSVGEKPSTSVILQKEIPEGLEADEKLVLLDEETAVEEAPRKQSVGSTPNTKKDAGSLGKETSNSVASRSVVSIPGTPVLLPPSRSDGSSADQKLTSSDVKNSANQVSRNLSVGSFSDTKEQDEGSLGNQTSSSQSVASGLAGELSNPVLLRSVVTVNSNEAEVELQSSIAEEDKSIAGKPTSSSQSVASAPVRKGPRGPVTLRSVVSMLQPSKAGGEPRPLVKKQERAGKDEDSCAKSMQSVTKPEEEATVDGGLHRVEPQSVASAQSLLSAAASLPISKGILSRQNSILEHSGTWSSSSMGLVKNPASQNQVAHEDASVSKSVLSANSQRASADAQSVASQRSKSVASRQSKSVASVEDAVSNAKSVHSPGSRNVLVDARSVASQQSKSVPPVDSDQQKGSSDVSIVKSIRSVKSQSIAADVSSVASRQRTSVPPVDFDQQKGSSAVSVAKSVRSAKSRSVSANAQSEASRQSKSVGSGENDQQKGSSHVSVAKSAHSSKSRSISADARSVAAGSSRYGADEDDAKSKKSVAKSSAPLELRSIASRQSSKAGSISQKSAVSAGRATPNSIVESKASGTSESILVDPLQSHIDRILGEESEASVDSIDVLVEAVDNGRINGKPPIHVHKKPVGLRSYMKFRDSRLPRRALVPQDVRDQDSKARKGVGVGSVRTSDSLFSFLSKSTKAKEQEASQDNAPPSSCPGLGVIGRIDIPADTLDTTSVHGAKSKDLTIAASTSTTHSVGVAIDPTDEKSTTTSLSATSITHSTEVATDPTDEKSTTASLPASVIDQQALASNQSHAKSETAARSCSSSEARTTPESTSLMVVVGLESSSTGKGSTSIAKMPMTDILHHARESEKNSNRKMGGKRAGLFSLLTGRKGVPALVEYEGQSVRKATVQEEHVIEEEQLESVAPGPLEASRSSEAEILTISSDPISTASKQQPAEIESQTADSTASKQLETTNNDKASSLAPVQAEARRGFLRTRVAVGTRSRSTDTERNGRSVVNEVEVMVDNGSVHEKCASVKAKQAGTDSSSVHCGKGLSVEEKSLVSRASRVTRGSQNKPKAAATSEEAERGGNKSLSARSVKNSSVEENSKVSSANRITGGANKPSTQGDVATKEKEEPPKSPDQPVGLLAFMSQRKDIKQHPIGFSKDTNLDNGSLGNVILVENSTDDVASVPRAQKSAISDLKKVQHPEPSRDEPSVDAAKKHKHAIQLIDASERDDGIEAVDADLQQPATSLVECVDRILGGSEDRKVVEQVEDDPPLVMLDEVSVADSNIGRHIHLNDQASSISVGDITDSGTEVSSTRASRSTVRRRNEHKPKNELPKKMVEKSSEAVDEVEAKAKAEEPKADEEAKAKNGAKNPKPRRNRKRKNRKPRREGCGADVAALRSDPRSDLRVGCLENLYMFDA